MTDGKVLGLITARGGSKGIPRKNVRPLAGKPLIAWTIEAAQAARSLDRVVLSSDDDEIIDVARAYGCDVPFRRPASLSRDDTPGVEPVLHALDELPGYDYVVLLQPTSPLRQAQDIDEAVTACLEAGASSCVSVTATEKPPEWMYYLRPDQRLQPVIPRDEAPARRQDITPSYALNGAVYVCDVSALRRTRRLVTEETVAHAMPRERSADVDTLLDFRWCELLLEHAASATGS